MREFLAPAAIRRWFAFGKMERRGDELFSLPPPDLTCYTYAMANRQDIPYSPGSPEIRWPRLLADIVFDGTKLAIDGRRPKATADGINCPFPRFSITQNCAHFSRQPGELSQFLNEV